MRKNKFIKVITEEWLESHRACSEGVDVYKKFKYKETIYILDKLNKGSNTKGKAEYIDYCWWLLDLVLPLKLKNKWKNEWVKLEDDKKYKKIDKKYIELLKKKLGEKL